MFCHRCGHQVEPGTRFCTQCGAALSLPQTDGANQPAAETPAAPAGTAPGISAGTVPANASYVATGNIHSAPDATPETFAATPLETSREATTTPLESADLQQATLKEAVESTRKRSRRRMPLILLVALALILVSSIAYAAYRVYTDIYLPHQQAQEAAANEAEVWVVDSATHSRDGQEFRWITYSYDNSGRLASTETTEQQGDEGFTSQTLFDYEGSRLTHITEQYLTQTSQGETYDYGGTVETTLAYDEDGRCIQAANFVTSQGDGGIVDDFTYDDQNRIATFERTLYFGGTEPDEDQLERSMEYRLAYDSDDVEGVNPRFTYVAGDASYPTPENTHSYGNPTYDEFGNLTSVEETLDVDVTAVVTYTYKKITVQRRNWIPNPFSNPAFGAGDLTNYQLFTQYTLRPERIEQIMTANSTA